MATKSRFPHVPVGAIRVPPARGNARHGDSVAPPLDCKGIVVDRQGPRPAVRGRGKKREKTDV